MMVVYMIVEVFLGEIVEEVVVVVGIDENVFYIGVFFFK